MNIIKKPLFSIAVLVILFFGVNAWLVWPDNSAFGLQPRFDWPDETANYFWINNFAQSNELFFLAPLNQVAQNQIHPRSINVRSDGALVPGSFLGMILFYGLLAKIFGVKLIFLLTPILSALAVLAFYFIIKKIFDEKIAWLSAILLLGHPAWWYYSAVAFLPNVAFIAILIISIYFLIKNQEISWVNLFLAALFGGLSLAIRPAEIVWLAIIYLVIFVYLRNNLNWQKIFSFGVIFGLMILPTFLEQYFIFGNFLTSGYSQLQNVSASTCQSCDLIKSIFFPFGFNIINIIKNVWHYLINNFWWLTCLTLIGLFFIIKNKEYQNKKIQIYLLLTGLVSAWLVIYYGSWQFTDLMTLNLNFLAVSYLRYWLIIYILMMPLAAIALLSLQKILPKNISKFFIVFSILVLFFTSSNLVIWSKPDSLWPVKQRIFSYYQTANLVNAVTEKEAIIITIRKDKVFFPERMVIHTFESFENNPELLSLTKELVKISPVYYFNSNQQPFLPESSGLKLTELNKFENELLFKVDLLSL